MRRILEICREELKRIFSDPGSVLLLFVAIFLYSFFYPMPYERNVMKKIPIALLDLDNTSLSRQLDRMVDSTEEVDVTRRPRNFEEAQKLFYSREVYGLIVIPEGFSRKINRQIQATISLYSDASYFLINRQVRGGVARAVGTLSAGVEIKHLEATGMNFHTAAVVRSPIQLVSTALGNPAGSYTAYVVPAVFVLILQQTLLAGICMLAGAPSKLMRRSTDGVIEIVIGKTFSYILLYLVYSCYYFIIVPRIYGFRQVGDPLILLIFIIPFLLSVIFLALGLASFSPDREVPMMMVVFSSLICVFLSGFSWPQDAFPSWVRIISWIVPSTAGINGILRINQMGAGLSDVIGEWLVLCGLVCVFFPFACWGETRLRRRLPFSQT